MTQIVAPSNAAQPLDTDVSEEAMAANPAEAALIERLRTVGLRPTRQRLALGGLLFHGEDRHVTAEQLHGEALTAGIRVSVATVYNTLHQFTEAGLLREVVVEAGRCYFDTNTSEHFHFFFEDDARLMDIHGPSANVLADAIPGLPDAPDGTRVERVDVIIRLKRA
ncbi:transcriptional repressor [Elstera cyanobacteriorum]|nr:transcriptional repressor [Elstera cyanobacteriorum]